MVTSTDLNKHLLARATFGVQLQQISQLTSERKEDFLHKIFTGHPIKKLELPSETVVDYMEPAKLTAEVRKEKLRKNRQNNLDLNIRWLNEMVNSEAQLQEKMALFWHGHFATRVVNSKFNEQILDIFRQNSLGNFKDLLFQVSKSAAMLQFLNNQQNKKGHPNENFAREVMELFTLGRGNYSETDIREAARAFTGWGFDQQGNFMFRKNQHDEGMKNVLGKSGNFTGEDVLKIILEKRECAEFLTRKILKFFVTEKPDERQVKAFAKDFYDSGYDIKKLLNAIFSSDYFFNDKNIGNKIKSPVELMAGIMRALPMDIKNPQNLTVYQKLLGQMLLYPPNVAGWPSGTAWIDSSTLLLRMQMPQIWTGLRALNQRPKADDDLDVGLKNPQDIPKNLNNLQATVDWQKVESAYGKYDPAAILLQTKSINPALLSASTDLKSRVITIMSSPDYQLC